eukprot:TRINITY_DN6189_c0_g1_i3.p2 TRINITY_DN6189_c0_g1~~TRINITY_DN6189_c0_g1_i3.p2  ORF type:complete len:224 (+),score=127.37 TRINITY_DN6189_c0_g1_i3:64-735(+)
MSLKLGDVVPNFTADTTIGKIDFHEWIGDSWAILFSHPADFTPVCTTEIGAMALYKDDFAKRNVKIIALSTDGVDDHKAWTIDILDHQKINELPFPIIADTDREIAIKYGMMDPAEKDKAGLPLTCRAVYIIGPQKKLLLSFLYPATTGRNFVEVLRVIDSLQLTANHKVATPANWKSGESCMIIQALSDEEAKKEFPQGWNSVALPSGKDYLRMVPQPGNKE